MGQVPGWGWITKGHRFDTFIEEWKPSSIWASRLNSSYAIPAGVLW